MKTYAIDLEGYYSKDLSLDQYGSVNYLNHPDTDIYMMAVAGDDGYRWTGRPEKFDWPKFAGERTVGHNFAFDGAIFEVRPQLPKPADFNCTMNLASWLGAGRSLEAAAKQLLGVDVSKETRKKAKGRSWESFSPDEQSQMAEYCLKDAELSLQLWLKYSDQWPAHEQRLSRATLAMGFRGLRIDRAKLTEYLSKVQQSAEAAAKGVPWAPVQSTKKAREHCVSLGLWVPSSFAQGSEACLKWEEEFGQTHAFVRALSDVRKANKLLRILEGVERRMMPNGRMNFDLKYHATHTGRWAGGGGVNVQGLHKNTSSGVNLRSLFIPETGKKFIVADLSQIEPRLIAWLVGDVALLDRVREGFGIYEAMATTWQLWAGAAGTLKGADSALYAYVKSLTLGAGYSLGPPKFRAVCLKNGIPMTPEEAQKRIEDYRRRNPLVVRKWKEFDHLLQRHLPAGNLTIVLPSGRTLKYPSLRRVRIPARQQPSLILGGAPTLIPAKTAIVAMLPTEKGVRPTELFGGKLLENVIQAIARDVFAVWLLALEASGIRVVLTIHDEVLLEVGTGVTPEDVIKLLQPPPWAPDLPLGADAHETMFYRKF